MKRQQFGNTLFLNDSDEKLKTEQNIEIVKNKKKQNPY